MDAKAKALLAHGKESYLKGHYLEAEGHLREFVALGHRFADVFNMLGVMCHAQTRYNEAVSAFEQALELNPRYTEAALNLSVTFNDLGRYDDAKRVYDGTLSNTEQSSEGIDPFAKGKLANMHAEVSGAYAEAGAWDEAMVELDKAINLCPDFPDLRYRKAEMLQHLGHMEEAAKQLEHAVKVRPSYVQAAVMLGVVQQALGDKDTAIATWKKVLETHPDHRAVKAYLRINGAAVE